MKKLGFENREILSTGEAHTLRDVLNIIDNYVAIAGNIDPDYIYVEGAESGVKMTLIEHTLTDGSKVYDVRVR